MNKFGFCCKRVGHAISYRALVSETPIKKQRRKELFSTFAKSQESDEIVFVPGKTPKSQPHRGTGSRWEQWFGASDEQDGDGRSSDNSNVLTVSSEYPPLDSGKTVDNLRRLQATTYDSLDWKVP